MWIVEHPQASGVGEPPTPLPTVVPPDATPLPDGPIDTTGWPTFHAASLGFSIRYPPGWEAKDREGIVYIDADERPGGGPYPFSYYVYVEEYLNPDGLSFEQVVHARWPGSEAFFEASPRQIGDYLVYESTRIPSAHGAKTIFFEDERCYVAVALTPYDETMPYVDQAKYDCLFEAMLLTFRFDGEVEQ